MTAAVSPARGQPEPGSPQKGGPAPLTRWEQGLPRALEATAPLWPARGIAPGWLDEAAHICAHPAGADRATGQARDAGLVAVIQQEAAPSPALQRRAAEFTKVTASAGTQVFPCYEVAELPRPHHDLEPGFGGVRHHLRRATGPQKVPASLGVCGAARLPAAVARRTPRFTATEVGPTHLERWRAKRTLLKQRRLPRRRGRRFRQEPEAYLQTVEARLVKLSLPP